MNVNGTVYLLSNNSLSSVNGTYADISGSIGADNLLIAKDAKTHLWGVVDSQGNIMTTFQYKTLIPTGTEYIVVQDENSDVYGVVDIYGREFMTPRYETLFYLHSGRFAFRENNLWGICDLMGNVVHEATYTYIRVLSGNLMASTLESYLKKWTVEDGMPSYNDDNVKLYQLDDNGEIAYTEQDMGHYHIRHSGDLYSIVSDNEIIVDYRLLSVEIVDNTTAIIKEIEGRCGFFFNGKTTYFYRYSNIVHLIDDTFDFCSDGNHTLGNLYGPISSHYDGIKIIDSQHFIAHLRKQGYYTQEANYKYVIIDKTGKLLSEEFDKIGEFENGFANAVQYGREGVIDAAGTKQENVVEIYGDYIFMKVLDFIISAIM